MPQGDRYPHGAPCWVETRQRDPERACAFYGALFGWRFVPEGDGLIARAGGGDVAGIAPLGPLAGAAWVTHVRVRGVAEAIAAVQSAGGSLAAPPASGVPAGWAALVRDPAGAVFGVWETGGHPGAQPVNEPDLWDLSELHTTDPAGAAAFYGQLFGWRAEPLGSTTLWRLPGYHGGIPGQPVPRDAIATMAPQDPDRVDARWSVDFRVDAADATADEAVRLGATVVEPPHDTPGFTTAVLADPQGATFSVTAFR